MLVWEVDSSFNTHTFTVSRKKGDTEETLATIQSQENVFIYTVKDFAVQLLNLFDDYKYKIKIDNNDATDWFSWDTQYRAFELDILDRNALVFKYDIGLPLYLYSERTDFSNVRCPKCWNVLKQMPDGNCSLCMDTGRQKPYLDPIVFWGDLGQKSRVLEHNLLEAVAGEKLLTLNGIPKIKPGDIILEPFQHELWLIESVQCIGRDTAPVIQQAKMTLVQRTNLKYNYMVLDDAELLSLSEEVNRINSERRF